MNAAAAVAAIQGRAARFRAGDRAPDGRQLALVVEGGALRGVCSAGGAVALEDLRMTDVFDHVYGTSAGVMNASYFVAGQARLGIRIYYEDMNRRAIVNPWRLWKILDLDWLFARAVMGNKRLDVDALLASRSRLFIATLEMASGAGRLFEAQALGTAEKVLAALHAATAAPLLYHGRPSVEGARCMDAGLVNAFPVEEAIAAGCTDILVMLTRPVGYRRRAAGGMTRWLFNRLHAGRQRAAGAGAGAAAPGRRPPARFGVRPRAGAGRREHRHHLHRRRRAGPAPHARSPAAARRRRGLRTQDAAGVRRRSRRLGAGLNRPLRAGPGRRTWRG